MKQCRQRSFGAILLTKYFVADIVLPDKISQQFLIFAVLVSNLGHQDIRDRSYGLNLEGRFTAVSQNVQPSSMAFKRTGSDCARSRSVPMEELRPMAPKPGTGTCWSPMDSVLTIVLVGSKSPDGGQHNYASRSGKWFCGLWNVNGRMCISSKRRRR